MITLINNQLTQSRQLVSKKLGPDNWIPIQMVLWSIVACTQSRLTGKATFFITRSLLGAIEGGFIPDVVLYLSYFYTSKELPFRLGLFWGAYGVTFIIGAFLAFGILHLGGTNGLAGWRWLFALEGALTAVIGIVSLYVCPGVMTPFSTPSCLFQTASIYLLRLLRRQAISEARLGGSQSGKRYDRVPQP